MSGPDAPPIADAPADDATKICAGTPYGHGLLTVCIDGTPPPGFTIGTVTQSTDGAGSPYPCNQVLKLVGAPEVCVIVGSTISVNGTLRATGTRALLLLGIDGLIVDSGGVIDVSSFSGSTGAGAAAMCSPGAKSGVSATGGTTGGGGGGGGGYGGRGGDGGAANTHGGGSGGTMIALTSVVGGCPGGAGGDTSTASGGMAGAGGGAVYLMSGFTITVTGRIDASGAGGERTPVSGGGAGGGAGGFIGLDASGYALENATMYAIGGGGSSGGGSNGPGIAGNTASGPTSTAAADPMNGAGIGASGNPGNGDSSSNIPCGGGTCPGGGGGGGGGGYIAVYNLAQAGQLANSIEPLPIEMP